MAELQRQTLNPDNPWPGLDPFDETDQEYFHGRTAESAELLRLVRRELLTVLFGRSGLGKTSLLKAGLFPRLREEDSLPVYVRLDHADEAPALREQIFHELQAACEAYQVQASHPSEDENLWSFFHRRDAEFWSERNRPVTPVIVFDQFEEIFTLGQETESAQARSAAFLGELSDLIENRPPDAIKQALEAEPTAARHFDFKRSTAKIVLSFREDFLAEMEGLKEQTPSLMYNRFRLLAMSGTQAYEVITRAGGELVADEVARRILRLAWKNEPSPPVEPSEFPKIEIDPALLSVVCTELNHKRQQASPPLDCITSDLLEGADREILSGFYERGTAGLDPRVRAFVEDELITERGYRDSRALEDAVARPGITSEALDTLIRRRLLRVDERQSVRRLELTHDVLTRVVKESRDQRRTEAEREVERQQEAEYRAKLLRSRQRSWAVATVAILLLGVIGFYYFGWVKLHYTYCRDFTKRWGVMYPVGPLPSSAVSHRSWTLRLTHRGWFGEVPTVEVIDADHQLTPNHNITTYLADSDAAPNGKEKECRYEFVYDSEGRIVYEVAWNRFGQMAWGFAYAPHTEPTGSRLKFAHAMFLGPDGYPQPQGHSRAEFVEFTYDKRGFEVERRYTDREGHPMPGRDNAYGQHSDYDKDGRLVRLTSLNELGAPMNDKVGNAGLEFAYDKDGNRIGSRAFDAKRQPTLVQGEYYRSIAQYDKWGRLTENRFFGLSDEPVIDTDQTGAHQVKWAFDERGNLINTKLYDTEDKPVVAGAGIFDFPAHEQRVTFDRQNRAEKVAYFAPDGKPLTGPETWHSYQLEYDKRGLVFAISYFDGEGKAVNLPTLGAHRREMINDYLGQTKEERFFDRSGKPVVVLNGGYHLCKNKYDKAGNLVRQAYFDTANNPVADVTDGVHRFVATFDRFRNQVLTRYFGTAGQPVNNAQGFHKVESNYDDYGAILGTHWYDKNGRPTNGPDGVHYVSDTYDSRGLLTGIVCFDAHNQPAVNKNGIHETLLEYNDKRQPTKWQYFGLNHKPVEDEDGDHLFLREFDERGRETKVTRLRADGSPNWDRELGIATRTRVFDRKNHWVEEAYFDVKDHLITGPQGFAKGSKIYHADGYVDLFQYGPDGKPVFNPLVGFAIRKMNSRQRGDTTESYHGPDGALITGPEGYAEIRRHWSDDGTLLAEAWFGPDGSPVTGPSGYHRMEHTPGGRKGTTRYFDAQNREITSFGLDTVVPIIFIAEITDIKTPAAQAGVHAGDILWRYGNWWFPAALATERSKGTQAGAISNALAEAFFAERNRLSAQPATMTIIRNGKPIELVMAPLSEGKNLGVRLVDRSIPVSTFEQWKTVGIGKRN